MNLKIFFIILAVLFSLFWFADSNAQTTTHLLENVTKTIPKGNDIKIDSDILELIQGKTIQQNKRSSEEILAGDKIQVYVYMNSKSDSLPENIPVISKADNIIFTKLSTQQISLLSANENVKRITTPINATFFNHDVSQGVNFSFANQMHNAGFDGSGITVAVIDGDFITSNSEISGNIVGTWKSPLCLNMACGATDGNSHGTAVAEIVVDMAPDVNLRLYSVANSVDFANAIDNAIANNVDVITASLGFPADGGDGTTGFYRDGTSLPAKRVNTAKNSGILVSIAAGNSGLSSWKGNYSPITPAQLGVTSPYQSFMNFRPSETGIQKICLPVIDVGSRYLLSWNDWDTTNQDYDLFLLDPTLSFEIDSSIVSQTGSQPPIEVIPEVPPLPPEFACIVVGSWSSTQNHLLHIDVNNNGVDPSVANRLGSISTPADAAGSLTVGAVDQATDLLEDFSSSGPTDDGRVKPEICGPDNTLSHQSELNPFLGTSAATPHVAGAAALLLEQTPNLSVEQLKHKLIDETRFNASYSVDNLCGSNSGALSLQTAALTNVYIPQGVSTPGCEATNSCYLPFTHTIFSGTEVIWYNGDNAAHTVTSGTPDGGPDGSFDSSLFSSGTSFSHTFNSVGNFDYFCLVHPWMTGKVIVNPSACSVPESGDWTQTFDCTLMSSATAFGKVTVQNNSVVTIPNGVTLDIDFVNHNLTVKFGSGVLIKAGGKIT